MKNISSMAALAALLLVGYVRQRLRPLMVVTGFLVSCTGKVRRYRARLVIS